MLRRKVVVVVKNQAPKEKQPRLHWMARHSHLCKIYWCPLQKSSRKTFENLSKVLPILGLLHDVMLMEHAEARTDGSNDDDHAWAKKLTYIQTKHHFKETNTHTKIYEYMQTNKHMITTPRSG